MMETPPQNRSKEPAEVHRHFPTTQSYEEFYGITDSAFTTPPGFENRKVDIKPTQVEEIKAPIVEEPAKSSQGVAKAAKPKPHEANAGEAKHAKKPEDKHIDDPNHKHSKRLDEKDIEVNHEAKHTEKKTDEKKHEGKQIVKKSEEKHIEKKQEEKHVDKKHEEKHAEKKKEEKHTEKKAEEKHVEKKHEEKLGEVKTKEKQPEKKTEEVKKHEKKEEGKKSDKHDSHEHEAAQEKEREEAKQKAKSKGKHEENKPEEIHADKPIEESKHKAVEVDSPTKPEGNTKEPAEDWVTVKTRGRKSKPGESSQSGLPSTQKFDSLAEMQMSNNKNKKKSLKKKLKEIKDLLAKQSAGEKLNPQQLQKVQNKDKLEKEIASIN